MKILPYPLPRTPTLRFYPHKVLRFVWGRARLPRGAWSHSFNLQASGRSTDSIPVSHTCFASLELPQYESEELLRAKLKIAMESLGVMLNR